MLSRLITRGNFLRSIRKIVSTPPIYAFSHLTSSTPKYTNFPKVFFLSLSYPLSKDAASDMENFDLKLKEACEKGEGAIKELMNFLKSSVLDISKAYKDSLKKQIEIIDVATKAGSQSQKWDELPEFRTKSLDLNQQLSVLITTVNILGQLSHNRALQYVVKKEKQFKLLANMHKELADLVKTQLKEIKQIEDELLKKKRDSIEKSF